jgi:thioredoxin reductase (NADPH)
VEAHYELVIVGGGIAGMTAAIYAAKANLRAIVLEKEICGGLANFTHSVENFPSYPRINGMELMNKVKAQVEGLGVPIEEISDVTGVEIECVRKRVITADQVYTAESMILATGRIPVRLPIETDWDEHIHYCSVCDGAAYKGKDLVVVGGGNSGFDECLYLIDLGVRSIQIIEAADACAAAKGTQTRALKTGLIHVRTGMQISQIAGEHGRGRIVARDCRTGVEKEIEADGVFVFMGQRPNTRVLEGIIALNPGGYILTDNAMATSCPGVFAAGDVVAKKYRQLTTAMADGTIAALEAARFVRERAATG